MNQLAAVVTEKKMSSLEIAGVMEKNHRDVMRDIRNLIDQEAITERNFALSEYKDGSGKMNPMFQLDFHATMVLITGYDARRRSLVIDRWLKVERGEAIPQATLDNPMAMHRALLKVPVITNLVNSVSALQEKMYRLSMPTLKPQLKKNARVLEVANVVMQTCEVDGDGQVDKNELYEAYRGLCQERGLYQEPRNTFFKLLYRSGLPIRAAKTAKEKGVVYTVRGLAWPQEVQ